MALTYRTSAAGGGTSGTGNRAATITPAVGDLFVVFCAVSGNTNTTPTCSDTNGGTYTLIRAALWGTSANTLSAFVRNQLLPNTTSTTVTVATGSNTAGEVVIVAYSGSGRAGAAAVRQSASQANQAASTTPAPAFSSAALTDNATLGAIGNSTNPATMTPPTGWTERQDTGQATPATGLEVVTRDSGFTGTTVTWGSTSGSVFASIIVELDATAIPDELYDDTQGPARVAERTLQTEVAKVSTRTQPALLGTLIRDQEEVIGGLKLGGGDEDFDWNRIYGTPRPVPATSYIRLPILPDPEEIPAATLTGWVFSSSATGQLAVPGPINAIKTVTVAYSAVAGDLIFVFYTTTNQTPGIGTNPSCTDDAGGTYTQLGINVAGLDGETWVCFVRNQYAASSGTINISVSQRIAINNSNTANMAVGILGYNGVPTWLQSQPTLAAIRQMQFWTSFQTPTVPPLVKFVFPQNLQYGNPIITFMTAQSGTAASLGTFPNFNRRISITSPIAQQIFGDDTTFNTISPPTNLIVTTGSGSFPHYAGIGIELQNSEIVVDEDFDPVFGQALEAMRTSAWLASRDRDVAVQVLNSFIQQDEVVTTAVTNTQDEDFWVSGVAPVYFVPMQPQVSFDDDSPAGALFGEPDEDFWVSGVPPVYFTPMAPSPNFDDPPPAGSLAGQPDEDFWRNPVAPVPSSSRVAMPLGDPEEIPAGDLTGQPDEDFWTNAVRPLFQSFRVAMPLGDPEEIPAGDLSGQDDEDFWTPKGPSWLPPPPVMAMRDDDVTVTTTIVDDEDTWQSGVAPLQQMFHVAMPLGDPEEIPAGDLSGQPDEDFWRNPVAPIASSSRVAMPLGDPEEIPAGDLSGQPDEDFWTNAVRPITQMFRVAMPLGDPEEIPAGDLSGQPDEDFWRNPVAPVASSSRVAMPLGNPEEIPAGDLSGQPDEDFWTNPVPPVPSSSRVAMPLGDPEELPAGDLSGQPDEDFWQNPVRPVDQTFRVAMPLGDPEELPAGDLTGQPDEDFWRSYVASLDQSFFQRLPIGDPEELPAGNLSGQPDEDFWLNPVAPVPSSSRVAMPLGDPEEIPAGDLSGQPDEDFWLNPVAPVAASSRVAMPLGDPEEIPAGDLSGQPDEDFWTNAVRPVDQSFRVAIPLGDPEELPAATLFGGEEDLWWRPLPTFDVPPTSRILVDTDDITFQPLDEDFWSVVLRVDQPSLVPRAFTDTDDITTAFQTIVDEDYWTVNRPLEPPVWMRLPVIDDSDFPPPQPPPPPPPTPSVGGTPLGMGGGGGGWAQYPPYCEDEEDPAKREECERPREELGATDVATAESPGFWKPLLKPFLVDVLVPGAAGYATTRAGGALGKKFIGGKHGEATGAIGTFLVTWLTERKKSRSAVAGSAVAALSTLYERYLKKPDATDPNEAPFMVRIMSEQAFVERLDQRRTPLRVQAHEQMMRGKSGRTYRMLVLRYFMEGQPGMLWVYQELRPMRSDGTFDVSTTLAERLRR